ncbi:Mitochodrial transcription termination factor-related [Macleaya cordata]|uniref:Mitochodrial transcription termination factor-related n=1 Tax=Macleaya cordata TaxID=56857 RepID=A0A200Q1Q7_MACCD|nr:Mitochodrial transcription termination factor-related [Macleaya cordata]
MFNLLSKKLKTVTRLPMPPSLCRFTPKQLSSSKNPDLVRATFKSFGLTETQLQGVISKVPALLTYNPESVLKPKLAFLFGFQVPSSVMADLIAKQPSILNMSLDKQIIPSYNLLREYAEQDSDIITILKRCPRAFKSSKDSIEACLRELGGEEGMPKSNITRLLIRAPRTFNVPIDKFRDIVLKVKSFGFNPRNQNFCTALQTLSSVSEEIWQNKLKVFPNFGWNEADVINLFRKSPRVMEGSEEKIREVLKFLVNKLNWGPAEASKYPVVFTLSPEKKLNPRYAVIQLLISKKKVNENIKLGPVFKMSDDTFKDKFIDGNEELVADLVDLF